MALIVLKRANLLILDEPTNHLDVESIEALEDGIEEYEGTVLLVSHDRALLRELATRVWSIEGDKIVDFGGTFVEWEQAKKDALLAQRAANALASDERRGRDKAKSKANAAAEADGQAARKAKKKEAEAAERAVQQAEKAVADLKAQIADPALYDGSGKNAKRAADLSKELAAAERKLNASLTRWEETGAV
jgi:ATP-binding cassette subfamily F protein 3